MLNVLELVKRIKELEMPPTVIMEVCGTHTMAIAENGIRSVLPPEIKLVSGPGCPVCVTPACEIDAYLKLSEDPDTVIATYGDMIRVPGSTRGDNLARRRAQGANVEVVYSPADAVEIAKDNSEKNVIFLGVGFETSAPGTAAATMTAQQEGVSNFSVYTMLKTCEPVLRTLCEQKDFEVKGFLCPGHVATIIGAKGFEFLSKDYGIPGVVSGFEGEDILLSIYLLLRQIKDGKAKIINEYTRGVTYEGNVEAQIIMREEFDTYDAVWRGLGKIEKSGLRLNKGNAPVIPLPEKDTPTGCRCGDVICGRLSPKECPMFGKVCTPEDPVGPCMVSSEGACSASYKYDYT